MIPLLDDCYRTELKVYPKNWNTKKASLRKEWYVWYRFHDPAHIAKYPKGRLIPLRGMNNLKDLAARQAVTSEIIATEIRLLDELGYNPITNKYMALPIIKEMPVTPETGLVAVLKWAFKMISPSGSEKEEIEAIPNGTGLGTKVISKSAADDMKSVLNYVYPAATELGFHELPIKEIKRRHIKLILDQVGVIKSKTVKKFKNGKVQHGRWTNNNYNAYKANLGILFSFLDEYELYESNPVLEIKRRKVTKKIREVLHDEAFDEVDQDLKATNYHYWRYTNIFKESGARHTELMALQDTHVDLEKKTFKVVVNKRDQPTEVVKVIDQGVLHLWKEIMAEAAKLREEPQPLPLYLFCVGRRPGYRQKPVSAIQVSRSWRKVKAKLGITADLYSLKHRRNTKDVDQFIEETIAAAHRKAAKKNSHTDSRMVEKVYDVKSKERREEIRKKLNEPG